MKTKAQILQAIQQGKKSECLDGRDFLRLANYFDVEVWPLFGFKLKDGATPPKPKELTEENILAELKDDLEFAFEKALHKRGISSSLMYATIKMWLWILDDPLQNHENYAYYRLPLFKIVAVKYGLENPIGADTGEEEKYNERLSEG